MNTVKIISIVLLAVFLIFSGLVHLLGFHMPWVASFFLGLCALISGILILLSTSEYYHFPEYYYYHHPRERETLEKEHEQIKNR